MKRRETDDNWNDYDLPSLVGDPVRDIKPTTIEVESRTEHVTLYGPDDRPLIVRRRIGFK